MREEHQSKCLTCKWVYVGKFNHIYGGRPIGCIKPEEKRLPNRGSCWEAKGDRDER